MSNSIHYTLGIDIGSTTVKIAILDEAHHILFSDYKRHFANIQETLSDLLKDSLSRFCLLYTSKRLRFFADILTLQKRNRFQRFFGIRRFLVFQQRVGFFYDFADLRRIHAFL